MSLQQDEYSLERLKKIDNQISGKKIDVKSDLLRAFSNPMNWIVESEVPDSLKDHFYEINNLILNHPPTKLNNAFKNSIESLNYDSCEKLVSNLKSFIFKYEIYVLKTRKI